MSLDARGVAHAVKELARNNFPVWQSDSVSGKALAASSSNSPAASAQPLTGSYCVPVPKRRKGGNTKLFHHYG